MVLGGLVLVLALSTCGLIQSGCGLGIDFRPQTVDLRSVIVQAQPGGERKARLAVARLGGSTGMRLSIDQRLRGEAACGASRTRFVVCRSCAR